MSIQIARLAAIPMLIIDDSAIKQAQANIELESLQISPELTALLSAPVSERLSTDKLLAILREQ